MDCQDFNNKSSNSIPETLDRHYMSIIRAVTIIITTPPPPHPRNLYTLYIYFFIFPILGLSDIEHIPQVKGHQNQKWQIT